MLSVQSWTWVQAASVERILDRQKGRREDDGCGEFDYVDIERCWRAISSVSRLRSFAFQLAMATSLDEMYPRRGTL